MYFPALILSFLVASAGARRHGLSRRAVTDDTPSLCPLDKNGASGALISNEGGSFVCAYPKGACHWAEVSEILLGNMRWSVDSGLKWAATGWHTAQ
jgi:hypothetical protein